MKFETNGDSSDDFLRVNGQSSKGSKRTLVFSGVLIGVSAVCMMYSSASQSAKMIPVENGFETSSLL